MIQAHMHKHMWLFVHACCTNNLFFPSFVSKSFQEEYNVKLSGNSQIGLHKRPPSQEAQKKTAKKEINQRNPGQTWDKKDSIMKPKLPTYLKL